MGRRTKHIVPTMFNLLKPAAMEHRIRETTHGEQETLYKWETHSECNPSTTPVNGKRPPTPRDSNPEPVTWLRMMEQTTDKTGSSCDQLVVIPHPTYLRGNSGWSCTWWLVYIIWHGVRYRHTVFKNHRKQIELALWWPVCAKSNMAATRNSECQITAPVTTKALWNATFPVVFSASNPYQRSVGWLKVILRSKVMFKVITV